MKSRNWFSPSLVWQSFAGYEFAAFFSSNSRVWCRFPLVEFRSLDFSASRFSRATHIFGQRPGVALHLSLMRHDGRDTLFAHLMPLYTRLISFLLETTEDYMKRAPVSFFFRCWGFNGRGLRRMGEKKTRFDTAISYIIRLSYWKYTFGSSFSLLSVQSFNFSDTTCLCLNLFQLSWWTFFFFLRRHVFQLSL